MLSFIKILLSTLVVAMMITLNIVWKDVPNWLVLAGICWTVITNLFLWKITFQKMWNHDEEYLNG